MSRHFQAPPNIADLIGNIVRDAQGALQRGQQGRKDEEEALFQKAIDLAELEISREQTAIKARPKEQRPKIDEMIAQAAQGLSLEELVKLQLQLTGRGQDKTEEGAKGRAAAVKPFLDSRSTTEVVGKKTVTTQPPFTQGTLDSLNALVTGQSFPVFPPPEPIGREVAGMPASARAQITEGLKEIYGLDQWNKLTQAEKDAVILAQFNNPR